MNAFHPHVLAASMISCSSWVTACALLLVLLCPRGLQAQETPSDADQAFADAFALYTSSHYAESRVAFETFRARYPEDPNAAEALYYQAEAALALGRDEEAIRLYNRLQRRYPAHPLASQAQLSLGKQFYENGLYERTIDYLEDFVATGPSEQDAAEALYWMGQSAVRLERYPEALDYFQRIEQEHRASEQAPAALYAMAQTQVRLDRLDDAAASFEQLAARYPSSPYVRDVGLALAEVYYELGDYNRAIREAQKQQGSLSGEARDRATFLLAESYNQLRQSEDAILQYRQLTEGRSDGPFYRQALYGLAWNYHLDDSYEWAADEFAKVRQGHDDELALKATYYEGVNRKLSNQPERAMELYREVIQRWPEATLAERALYELALGYYEQRRWEEANSTFERFLRAHPNSELRGEAMRYLGSTYIALGNSEAATASFEKAVDLDAAPPTLKAELRFQKAWLLYRNRKYEQAASAFQDFLQTHPDAPDASQALFWLGESLFQLGRYDQAEQRFGQYLREHSGGRHADAARYALGWTFFKQQRYRDAAQQFERFLDVYRDEGDIPYRTDALLRLGDSYYALKQFDDAIRAYSRVAERGEEYALYQIGQAAYNAGNLNRSISAFNELLTEYPESQWREEAQYRLGYIHLQRQEYDQAIDAYRTLLRSYPQDPLAARAQYGIGDAHFNAGQQEDAVQAYLEVLRRYPNSDFAGDAASSLQYALMAMDDEDRADQIIQEFARDNPNSPVVDQLRFRRAEVFYQSGQTNEALSALQGFVRTSESTDLLPEAYYYLGTIYADRSRLQEAESYLQQIVGNFPSSPRRADAAERLGELYLEQERYANALDMYRRLGSMESVNHERAARAAYGQSRALMGLGRTDEAEQILQDVITGAPESPETMLARLGLARVYEEQGQTDEALRLYRQIVDASDTEAGAEALYRLGSLLLDQGEARAAIENLSRMPTLFPGSSEWLARSYLTQARAFSALGRKGDATQLYDRIIEEFTGTPFAAEAREAKQAL